MEKISLYLEKLGNSLYHYSLNHKKGQNTDHVTEPFQNKTKQNNIKQTKIKLN